MEKQKRKQYNKEQAKAYALIAFNNWKNSANKDNTNLENIEIFLDPVFDIYEKENVIEVKNRLIETEKMSEKN